MFRLESHSNPHPFLLNDMTKTSDKHNDIINRVTIADYLHEYYYLLICIFQLFCVFFAFLLRTSFRLAVDVARIALALP